MRFWRIVSLFLVALLEQGESDGIRGCYYTNWSQYRGSPASFFPEDIDPTLCSHIFYAFADMDGNRLVPIEWNDFDLYARVNALKEVQPDLKTLLSVGGWNFDLQKMSAMLATKENREEFIETSIEYLRRHKFDGLDMDWEYPGDTDRGSVPEDRERFTFLCQEMRVAFDAEGIATGRAPLLMTSAVPAGKDNIDNGYEIELIARELDLIMIMTYDFHGSWEAYTGAHTALYPRSEETGYQRYLNVEFAAEYWSDGGTPRDKLVLGMGTYGRGWTLSDSENNGMGAPANGGSPPGPWTSESGMYAYYEVCSELLGQGGTVEWHDEHKVPYTYLGNVWCSYDDEQSIGEKMNFLRTGGYAGWMIWAVDLDDFNDSHCGQGTYPLLRALNRA